MSNTNTIVRIPLAKLLPHPEIENCFELINGHHRTEALRQIGETFADCIIWDVDDDQTRILLATLNRLGGKDELSAKVSLLKNLSEKYSSKELAKLLPDTRTVIDRLKDITKPMDCLTENPNLFLNSMVFFLNDEQLKTVNDALENAIKTGLTPRPDLGVSSKSQKLANAITIIAKQYLNTGR